MNVELTHKSQRKYALTVEKLRQAGHEPTAGELRFVRRLVTMIQALEAEPEETRMIRGTFTVEGNDAFPIDMLRFDYCWPRTQDDALMIEASMGAIASGPWRIRLHTAKDTAPTAARWKGFGWKAVAE